MPWCRGGNGPAAPKHSPSGGPVARAGPNPEPRPLAPQSWLLNGLLAALLLVGACSSTKPERPTPGQEHRTIAEGYSLLYDITSQQKGMKKLLVVKTESDPVDKVVSDIAEYADELTTQLEDMASRYPALTVETQFLPTIEVKTRESIASATTKAFLTTSGTEFERDLLLRQRSALEQEEHLAKVMVEMETADERRAFWRRVEERFTELRSEVDAVLREHFFCN